MKKVPLESDVPQINSPGETDAPASCLESTALGSGIETSALSSGLETTALANGHEATVLDSGLEATVLYEQTPAVRGNLMFAGPSPDGVADGSSAGPAPDDVSLIQQEACIQFSRHKKEKTFSAPILLVAERACAAAARYHH